MPTSSASDPRLSAFVRDSLARAGHRTRCRLERVAGSRSAVYDVSVNGGAPSYVAKESSLAEIDALERFERARIDGVPRIVAADTAAAPPLLLMPRYPGRHGEFGDLHPRAIDTLALIHNHFAPPAQRSGLPPLSLDALFDWAFGDLSIYSPASRPRMRSIRDAIEVFATLATGFATSLVHWDMHPDNVLAEGDDAVIVDWEHACAGPPLIDLVNMLDRDSAGFRSYASAWTRRAGEPFDWIGRQAELDWCRAVIQIRYLFVPARAGDPARSAAMAGAVTEYLDRMGRG